MNQSTQGIRSLFPSATDEQVAAVESQMAVYAEDWCPAEGLSHIGVSSFQERCEDGRIAVEFHYVASETQTGLEVTIFDRDGSVESSQDFG